MRSAALACACWVVGCAQARTPGGVTDTHARSHAVSPPVSLVEASATDAGAHGGTRAQIALFRRFPALAERLPRVALLDGPTPVERFERVENELGIARVFVKRDDLTARPYGGGKPRKLEFLLASALAGGHSTVVTIGAVASHHALATAIYGRRAGLSVVLLLLPQPKSAEARANLLAEADAGATLRLSASERAAEAEAEALAAPPPAGKGAYVVPTGGTSALGNLGYVNAGFELDEQIAQGLLPEPDFVYVPLGTTGTAVGLAIGLEAAGRRTRVVGVRVSSPQTSSQRRLEAEFVATVQLLTGADPSFPRVSFADAGMRVVGDQLGGGYGASTPEAVRAVDLGRRWAGLELETTYSGKAFAALMADAPRLGDRTVLFWYTDATQPVPFSAEARGRVPAELRGYVEP